MSILTTPTNYSSKTKLKSRNSNNFNNQNNFSTPESPWRKNKASLPEAHHNTVRNIELLEKVNKYQEIEYEK